VIERLRSFISPLAIDSAEERQGDLLGPHWEGWPFGQALYISELYTLIQNVPGVKHVRDVQLSQRPITPAKEAPRQEGGAEPSVPPPPLTPVNGRLVEIPADTLFCSLDHEIKLTEL
jgi:hypothetical protein